MESQETLDLRETKESLESLGRLDLLDTSDPLDLLVTEAPQERGESQGLRDPLEIQEPRDLSE